MWSLGISIGLSQLPRRLLNQRCAIIHAVKNDAAYSEAEIRAYFSEKRGTVPALPDADGGPEGFAPIDRRES